MGKLILYHGTPDKIVLFDRKFGFSKRMGSMST